MPEPREGGLPTPVTPIRYLDDWRFEIVCEACQRRSYVRAVEVIRRVPQDAPLYRVLGRFRCHGGVPEYPCRGRPSRIVLAKVSGSGPTAQLRQDIELRPRRQGNAIEWERSR